MKQFGKGCRKYLALVLRIKADTGKITIQITFKNLVQHVTNYGEESISWEILDATRLLKSALHLPICSLTDWQVSVLSKRNAIFPIEIKIRNHIRSFESL